MIAPPKSLRASLTTDTDNGLKLRVGSSSIRTLARVKTMFK